MPADDSDSDHGITPKIDAASASIAVSVKATMQRERAGRARPGATLGTSAASTIRKPPQPTSAAAWLKKVADGATLKAISVGRATAAVATKASQ